MTVTLYSEWCGSTYICSRLAYKTKLYIHIVYCIRNTYVRECVSAFCKNVPHNASLLYPCIVWQRKHKLPAHKDIRTYVRMCVTMYVAVADSLLLGLLKHMCFFVFVLLCFKGWQLLLLFHHFQLILEKLLGYPPLLLPLLLGSIMHTKYGLHRVRLARGKRRRLESHLCTAYVQTYICTYIQGQSIVNTSVHMPVCMWGMLVKSLSWTPLHLACTYVCTAHYVHARLYTLYYRGRYIHTYVPPTSHHSTYVRMYVRTYTLLQQGTPHLPHTALTAHHTTVPAWFFHCLQLA